MRSKLLDLYKSVKINKIQQNIKIILPDGTQIICKPSQVKDVLENNSENQLPKILKVYC